jgi:hypothetical protein
MGRSLALESTLHSKLGSRWHWATVSRIFWDGGISMMEISVYTY